MTTSWASRWMWPARPLTRRRAPARTTAARDRQHRLLRWATLLERDPHQIIGLLSPSWACGDARGAMVDRLSAIDVAWNDVVLRVMGSAGRPRGDAKSFFGLSDAELDHLVAVVMAWIEAELSAQPAPPTRISPPPTAPQSSLIQ